MPKVLVVKDVLLPPSETFIINQIDALTRYRALLCGLEQCLPSLALERESLLLTKNLGAIGSLRAKLYRRTGIAPFFHRRATLFQPDLVHAHFASGGLVAMPLAHHLGVPLIVTFHGADVTIRHSKSTRYDRLAKEATYFICVSKFIRDCAIRLGFPPDKLIVHHIGIDRAVFAPTTPCPDKKGVLFVGRLVEKKGCEYLLRAMRLVQNEDLGCELTIIGDGPLHSALQELASNLRLHCRFQGAQPPSLVREALSATRVLCAPSVTAANGDSEGLPTTVVEAQSMGIPVVSTIHAGIPEVVIDGVTGSLTPERDPEALSKAILALTRDDHLWQRFRLAAPLLIADQFDIRIQTRILETIYDRSISRL